MNGKRFLLDTNTISSLLGENKSLLKRLKDAEWIGISIISLIEIRVFAGLDNSSKQRLEAFVSKIEVVDLAFKSTDLLARTIQIRQNHRVKLPDAIIAATAIEQNAVLITNDGTLKRIPELTLLDFMSVKDR